MEGNYEYDDSDRLEEDKNQRQMDAVLYLLAVGELPERDEHEENPLTEEERTDLLARWEGRPGSRLVDAVYESIGHFLEADL